MSDIVKATNLLESKLDVFLEAFEFLKEENEFLHKRLATLEIQLSEQHERLSEKEQSYQMLKIAKTIEGSDKSTRDTKLKINALIREIDKCIVQLSE